MLINGRRDGLLIARQDVPAFRGLSSGGHYRADKKRVPMARNPVVHEMVMQFVYALAVQIDDVLEQHVGTRAWFVMRTAYGTLQKWRVWYSRIAGTLARSACSFGLRNGAWAATSAM